MSAQMRHGWVAASFQCCMSALRPACWPATDAVVLSTDTHSLRSVCKEAAGVLWSSSCRLLTGSSCCCCCPARPPRPRLADGSAAHRCQAGQHQLEANASACLLLIQQGCLCGSRAVCAPHGSTAACSKGGYVLPAAAQRTFMVLSLALARLGCPPASGRLLLVVVCMAAADQSAPHA